MRIFKSAINIILTFTFLCIASGANAQVSRTPWEMHNGFDQYSGGYVIPVNFSPSCLSAPGGYTPAHGALCEFEVADIPAVEANGWGPAPNPDIIGFGGPNASLLGPGTCRRQGDFTYFQTFVEVGPNTTVNSFTIQFNGMDDGSIVSICDGNTCSAVPGSHVTLSNGGTTDLSTLLKPGTNRVVITQVDDCPTGNTLASAKVVLNGTVIDVVVDDDGDGVPNDQDLCPNTDLESTVTMFGVNSGVVNTVSATGCSISDSVNAIEADCGVETNHGRFVSCTAHGLNDLRDSGVITDAEKDALQSAAGQSSVGKPPKSKGKK